MKQSSRYTKEKIYDLLPSIYRIRDKEQGEPLKALLEIIAQQIEFVEQDIDRLYNNWFIETCDEWIVPYIGDLLKAKILNPVTRSTTNHRSWVANTISYRRRKGTPVTIEQLSRDVTGWSCNTVEFFHNLITTQYINRRRFEPKATAELLRNKDLLEVIGPPFDRSARTVDLRHVDSKRGYYNIPSIGIFLWRLQAYPVVHAPAFSLGEGKYTFSQLGYDLPIYNYPETETSLDHIATDLNVPTRIRRRILEKYLEIHKTERNNFAYQKSIKIVKRVRVENENGEQIIESLITPDSITVCNLSKWHHRPPKEKVGIDPELGRIIFPKSESEKIVDVHVSYYYGFSGDIGGGFYDRKESGEKEAILLMSEELQQDLPYHYKISKKSPKIYHISLSKAIEKWKTEKFHDKRDVIFEIIDSEIYDIDGDGNNTTPLEIEIPENITVVIRSQNLQRPVFWLNKPITVKGKKGSNIIFDGILFTSSEIQMYDNNNTILKIAKGDLSKLIINHCTFVPERIKQENTRIKQEKNMGRFLFSWENQVEDDITRLKKYLFDILNEEWILADNVVLNKVTTDNNIIEIIPAGTNNPSIKLELNSPLSLIFIKIREIGEEENQGEEFRTIYKLPISELNGVTKVYSSLYSIGIFGDNTQGINNNNNNSLKISISRSILGRIDSSSCHASLKIVDSIIDGKGVIEVIRCNSANIENATVFGKISSTILNFANNSIFTDILDIERRQQGCIRFCYIPDGSQIPIPYRCVMEYPPNSGINLRTSDVTSADSTPESRNITEIRRRIRPRFTSNNYGDDGYGQLHREIDKMIFEGGENRSEIGAFNHLFNPQRIKNLSSTLDEYIKFGLEAGIFLVT